MMCDVTGDGILQDGQAAADHLQLLPLLSRRGGLHHRRLLHAHLHCQYDSRYTLTLDKKDNRLKKHRYLAISVRVKQSFINTV